jgi:DNA repair protein RadD
MDSFEDRSDNESARHLVFVTIVSEGYDFVPIDCVVLMRPTRSPVLYVQTVGRGLRPYKDKKDCLVLDYGSVVESCGPLNEPHIGKARRGKKSEELFKRCPNCSEYVGKNKFFCPVCDYSFHQKRDLPTLRSEADEYSNILGESKPREIKIKNVFLQMHRSKNGNDCLKIVYQPENIFESQINEFFVWSHDYAYKKAIKRLAELSVEIEHDLTDQVNNKRIGRMPTRITVIKDGIFDKVKDVIF